MERFRRRRGLSSVVRLLSSGTRMSAEMSVRRLRAAIARRCSRVPLRVWGASDQAERAISTGWLHALLRFHLRPIDVVVFHGSSGRTGFEGGFPLRCFQRLSRPHIATRRCRWRDNRYTRGASIPVLSY